MIASFFRSLEANRVEYLLISGQAAVLYGAAVFSEDIDLRINPSEESLSRVLLALRQNEARYYKHTPELTLANVSRGHGFHYLLPGQGGTYLDVMGTPPRVGEFPRAATRANQMDTEWGRLPVVSILDLIELKKTQRLEDYPVISRLVLEYCRRFAGTKTDELIDWAMMHLFTLESLVEFIRGPWLTDFRYTGRYNEQVESVRKEINLLRGLSESLERGLTNWMQLRMAEHQAQDREYWKPVIGELRCLRADRKLMEEGKPL